MWRSTAMPLPVRSLAVAADDLALAVFQIDKTVIGPGGEIMKVLLDAIALVAARYEEILEPVARVYRHDVPKDRLPADLYHRFGPKGCFF